MARATTNADIQTILTIYETVEIEPDIYFLYDFKHPTLKRHFVMAIVFDLGTELLIDAEPDIISQIPGAQNSTLDPRPLYDTYVSAYGFTAKSLGIERIGETYAGHKIKQSEASAVEWETIRLLEYQIAASEPEE